MKLNVNLPDEVETALDRYRPRASHSPVMAALFPQVRDEVVAAVRSTVPLVPETARARMSFTAWYVTWLVEQGLWEPDSGPVPFTESTVESFVDAARDGGYGSPATLRSQLGLVGRAYLPGFWTDGTPDADVAGGPYLPVEVQALWRAATSFRHDNGDATVAAVVAAGAGAGLTGEDFRVVRGRNVVRDENGHVFVQVRGHDHSRTVPVARRWADRLVPLGEVLGDQLLVGGMTSTSAHPAGAVTARARRSGMSMLSIRKLRATWLLDRLDDGVPTDVLVRYAGLQSTHALNRLLPRVGSRPADVEFALVRGDLARR